MGQHAPESTDSLVKNYSQGIICLKIAKLFPDINTVIRLSVPKQSNYYLAASDYFTACKDTNSADQALSKYFLNYASIASPTEAYTESARYSLYEADVLHYLKQWYLTKRNKDGSLDAKKFQWVNIIGTILKGENKFKEAKPYFLFALLCASSINDLEHIPECLFNVSSIYALLANKDLTLKYSDLAITIGSKIKDESMNKHETVYLKALLNKASVFYELKYYDSVLAYTAKVISRASVNDKSSYKSINIAAIKLKIKTLTLLKSDSISIYKITYHEEVLELTQRLIELMNNETQMTSNAINDMKTWEVSTEKYERGQVEILNKKISNRNLWLIIGVVFLFISILGVAYFYRKSIRQAKAIKGNLDQQIAFKNIMTHDIKKLVNGIPLILKRAEKSESFSAAGKADIEHIKNVAEYVNHIFRMSSQQINTISEQLTLAEIYAETFKQTSLPSHYKIHINNKIKDDFILTKLPIPTLLLNNFIKNSIEHGFADQKQSVLDIIINCSQTSEGYKITIGDNGCGLNYAKSTGGTQGNGIAFAKETINVYNLNGREFTINFSNNSIFDKQDKDMGRGTIVIIELIKNKKWKLES